MPGSLRLRGATKADIAAIAAVFAPYATETLVTFETNAPTEGEWLDRLQATHRAGHPFLVATLDSAVIGYAFVAPWKTKPGYAHTVENSIYLAPEHAGYGYGRRLLQELLVRAGDAGVRQVIAVIADGGSPASQKLHSSAGFTEVGRLNRVGIKLGQWIDTVLMQRSLETPVIVDREYP